MKRRVVLVAVIVVALGLLVALLTERSEHRTTQRLYATTQAAEDSLRRSYESAVTAIVEIQDSLSAIMPSEAQVIHLTQGLETGGTVNRARRDQVMQRISDLHASIESSKQMIRRLEERLKDREGKIAGLERLIENLKKTVALREEMITALSARVDSLRTRVGVLESDVAEGHRQIREQAETIEARDRELSTVYYVVSSHAGLKRLGVVRDEGGVLGLGRTSKLSGDMDPNVFTPFDTDTETTLKIHGEKVVVLSGQDRASYQLVQLSEDWAELRITNPSEFRKVRYLVVQVN
jgi:predicted RNase H-like nuclease (RuvC/YqgF family)